MKDSEERAHVHAQRCFLFPATAAAAYMHACSLSLQALVLFISTRGALAATHSTAHMALPERRYKTEDGGGALGERRRKGDETGRASGVQLGGRRGEEEGEVEAQMEVKERKQRAWLILHQTCPRSFSVCPPSSPPPPPILPAIFRQKL